MRRTVPVGRRCSLCLVVALLFAASSRARTLPATNLGTTIPDVSVMKEGADPASLRSILAGMGNGPVVILPVYTRCRVSCPLQTQKLKEAIASLGFGGSLRVLVFSFDPAETSATVQEYRSRERVPDNWVVVTAQEGAVRKFFDFFQYAVMDDNGTLIHPDQIFVLDPSLRWRFTIVGVNWNSREVGQVIALVRSPGILRWISTHPDDLAWAGLWSIVLSVGLLGVWVVRTKHRERTLAR